MSQVTIRIPQPLREFTSGREILEVEAATVREALGRAGEACPGLLARILTPEGERRAFVNIFVEETDVRRLDGLDSALADGDNLHVIAAVAGG